MAKGAAMATACGAAGPSAMGLAAATPAAAEVMAEVAAQKEAGREAAAAGWAAVALAVVGGVVGTAGAEPTEVERAAAPAAASASVGRYPSYQNYWLDRGCRSCGTQTAIRARFRRRACERSVFWFNTRKLSGCDHSERREGPESPVARE